MFFNKIESRHLLSPQSVQYQCGDSIKKGHEKRRSSSRGDGSEERPHNQYCGELPPQCGLHTHFAPHPGKQCHAPSVSSLAVPVFTVCCPCEISPPVFDIFVCLWSSLRCLRKESPTLKRVVDPCCRV